MQGLERQKLELQQKNRALVAQVEELRSGGLSSSSVLDETALVFGSATASGWQNVIESVPNAAAESQPHGVGGGGGGYQHDHPQQQQQFQHQQHPYNNSYSASQHPVHAVAATPGIYQTPGPTQLAPGTVST